MCLTLTLPSSMHCGLTAWHPDNGRARQMEPTFARKGWIWAGVARAGILLAADAPCRGTQARPPAPRAEGADPARVPPRPQGATGTAEVLVTALEGLASGRAGGGNTGRQPHRPRSSTTGQPRKCLIVNSPLPSLQAVRVQGPPTHQPAQPVCSLAPNAQAWNQTADLGPVQRGPDR